MKFPKISIVFNRLKYQSLTGQYPVYLRINHKGRTDFQKIQDVPNIHQLDWVGDAANGLYTKNLSLNTKINEVLANTRNWAYDQVLKGNQLSADIIKDHVRRPVVDSTTTAPPEVLQVAALVKLGKTGREIALIMWNDESEAAKRKMNRYIKDGIKKYPKVFNASAR
jgi:hypothetical protein